MNKVQLIKKSHNVKIGDDIPNLTPNLNEDTLFMEGDEVIGFYVRDVTKYSDKLANFISIANNEFRSERVPKSLMRRSSALNAIREGGKGVEQYSTIIGSVPPKPHMRRAYPSISSVHSVKSAEVYVKAMLLACKEAENILLKLAPEVYNKQYQILQEEVEPQWRLGNLFTSSISNYNISASAHIDTGNIKECVNVIITKRKDSTGGNLHLPDYDITIDCCDNSMIVYPAWKSIHAVTPIHAQANNGYRNSLIFYPLKAFLKVYGQ